MTADSTLTPIPDDAIVLVSGPPMTGKYQLLLELLARRVQRTILISTKNRGDRIRDDFRSIATDVPEDQVGVVDCVSHQQSMADAVDTATTKFAPSPENATQIGVKFVELFESFHDEAGGDPVGVGLHSLSQLVMHADLQTVYQFLQVLTGQIRSVEWFGAAVIDDSVIDIEEHQTLSHHFDGIIETRENEEGRRQLRLRGFEPSASPWTDF